MHNNLDEFLRDAAERSRDNLVSVSIRDLLARWGQKRRGPRVVSRVERDLSRLGLTTEPHFTNGWIDSVVQLVPRRLIAQETAERAAGPDARADIADEATEGSQVGLQIRSLESASRKVCSVPPQSDLVYVQSLMLRHDYSQLAVMTGPRDLRGAVTWESIARAKLKVEEAQFKDCIVRAQTVGLDEDLIPLIPRINEAGYIFVVDERREVCGIVTPSDVTLEFATLARPFFLIGEIERRLRVAIDLRFSADELAAAVDARDAEREVAAADDLTPGEYLRLLENPDNWKRMDWPADRVVFVHALTEVRDVRNEIMHFSPDPIEEEPIDALRVFIDWLRFLED